MKTTLKSKLSILIFFQFLISSINTNGQYPLTIGQQLPIVDFGKNFNSHYKISNTAELKNKIVILDFFNHACMACIKGIPKMDSLQKKFGDKLQIVLITNSNQTQVQKMFDKHVKIPDLPVIIEDSFFYDTLFAHEGDPLHVWIDKTGVIAAITNGYNATESNIDHILRGNTPDFYVRPEKSMIDPVKDLVKQLNNLPEDILQSYSLFFKPLISYTLFSQIVEFKDSIDHEPYKLRAINIPLTTLFTYAFSKELYTFDVNFRNLEFCNLLKIETSHPLDLHYSIADSSLDEWNRRNLVSYEHVGTHWNNYFKAIQDDLERYTPFTAKIDSRKCESLVLKYSGNKKNLINIPTSQVSQNYYETNSYVIENKTIKEALLPVLVIAYQNSPYPLVDETGIEFPISMRLDGDISNLDTLNRSLHKYGFTIEIESRINNFLVIKDKRPPES